jgi:hypothetical protein
MEVLTILIIQGMVALLLVMVAVEAVVVGQAVQLEVDIKV